MRGQPLPDGGYVTTYTDITEFKQTEQDLREAKLNLEQRVEERTWELQSALESQRLAKRAAEDANLTKTRFVAAASHDLLQPLNAARLFATALQDRLDDDGLKEMAGRIETSLRVSEEVLDDILDMARLEGGAMHAEITDFPVADVLQELQVQFAPLAQRRGLQLRVVKQPCWVHTDRVLLRRILQNLVSNALRYTQRGGVLVGCRRRGSHVEVQVWDSGPGIPERNQRMIFGEFRRLGAASPWGEHGLGLGLSICDRIARLLGLQLGLRSQPGRGSVFSVRVPRCEDAVARQRAAAVAAKPAVALPSSLVGLTVLCVDNEQEILDGMQALLGRWGMKVLTARDSDEALRLAGSERPQVLLVDYRLSKGDRDGLDLLEELSRGRAEPLAAALITADHGSDVAERARSLGIPLMRKPVKPAALRAMLSALAIRSAIAATGTNGA
jgi:signal transduction histidine kinase/ActR/RegA family two-component response regulator